MTPFSLTLAVVKFSSVTAGLTSTVTAAVLVAEGEPLSATVKLMMASDPARRKASS
jgi:hypothetical protein